MLPDDQRPLLTDSPDEQPAVAAFAPHFASSSSSSSSAQLSPPTASAAPRSSSTSIRDPFAFPPAPRRSTLGARKGKGRALDVPLDGGLSPGNGDDDDDEGRSSAQPTGFSFCVRFTDGQTDDLLDLWVGEKESVREVKRRLRLLRPKTLFEDDKPRRLRLIQLGRLLPDGVFLVPYTAQLLSKRAQLDQGSAGDSALREGLQAVGRGLGKVVRGTASAVSGPTRAAEGEDDLDALERGAAGGSGEDREGEEGATVQEEEQIWLHCSVGDVEQDEEPAEDTNQAAQITPLQGFDRLRDAGFSEEDIEQLRTEFRETRGAAATAAAAEPGDDDEHQRALEDQWLSGMTGSEEAAGAEASTAGNYYSLLKGISIGFFAPFLPLFFFRTQLFTKRTQIAIVLGVIINLGFGFLRMIG
ncbi:hypothetical protein JCM3775_001966 [Rhodotorula graminis]